MKSLNTKLVVLLLLILAARSAVAEVIRWPQSCLNGVLHIKNLTSTDTRAWLQKFEPTLISETEYRLPARTLTKININAASTSEMYSLLHFRKLNTLQTSFKCDDKNYQAHSFEGGRLTFRRTDLARNKIWLQNLFTDENIFEIEFLNRRQQIVTSTTVKLRSLAQMYFWSPDDGSAWAYVRIHAQNRFTAFNFNSTGSEGPLLLAPQSSVVNKAGAYFLVGPQDQQGDSFTIHIEDPALITKAREQILDPKQEKIVFAKIKKGHGGFNRNWLKKEKSFWSWSTTEITNIADLGSTSCNGLPQTVEDRVDPWVQGSGRICFWSYRIQKELSYEEVALGTRPQ